jgi:hypothetical protein
MQEYNMAASLVACAARFQILCLRRSASDGLQAAWKRPAQATREAAFNQQSVRGSIGVSQGSQGRKGIIGIDR